MTRASTNPRPRLTRVFCALAWLAFSASAFPAGLSFAGAPLTPGGTARVSVPLSELEKSYVTEGGNVVPSYTLATLAVPRGFDPKKTWPVLIVFSSSDHQFPSWYDMMGWYRGDLANLSTNYLRIMCFMTSQNNDRAYPSQA